MTDIIIESISAIILGAIVTIMLMRQRQAGAMREIQGWNSIIAGFVLVLIGSLFDISDNFPSLNKYLIFGHTPYEVFMEKVIGYMLGFILIANGLRQWLPVIFLARKTSESLRESNELLSLYIRHSPVYTYIKEVTPTQSRVLQASDNFTTMIGIPGSDMTGKTMAELFPPALAAKITADDYAVAACGEVRTFEEELNGRSYSSIKFPIIRGDKTLLAGYTIDITERKHAEETKDRLLMAISAASEGIAITDEKDRFIFVNDAHARIYGCLQGELLGKTWRDTVPADLQPLIEKDLSGTLHNRSVATWSGACPALRKDGTVLPTEITAASRWDERGNYLGHICIIRDISEREQAEEKIRQSEAKYRNLFDSSTDGIFIIGLDGNFVDVNTTAHARLGYSKEELLALPISKLDHPEFAPRVHERLGLIRDQGVAIFESAHLRKDGTTMPVEVNSRLIEYEGRPVYFSIVRDITQRKQAEEKIRRSDEFVRNILNSVDEGFIVVGRDYRILSTNKAYCIQVGGCEEEILGQHCYEVSHRSKLPCYEDGEDCATQHVFETGNPYSALHKHKDAGGNILYVETKAFPLKDDSGAVTAVIETINNITEKHLLEEERLKTQKLESIGTLAGGIAHDFNNLLQGVFGYISLAKITVKNPEKSTANLEKAEKALYQTVNLTTQLLTFSKGGKPAKKLIDLRLVIENAAKFSLSGSRSELCLNLPEDLWQAEADEGQLGQVLQNIVLNADQSMPVGGTIKITAANLAPGAASLPPGLAWGNYVTIAIQDSGAGIPEQYLTKIFDPYFTTKEKGSGLGLATCYSIVRNHSGMIDVRTKPGEGSTFLIYLPAIVGQVPKKALEKQQIPSQSSMAKVLVMDDEDFIRDLSSALLGELGHEVVVAKHGQEALEKYQGAIALGRPFDIVILDLTIRGGMGGVETVQELLKIDPQVKAVVSSGYSDDAATADYLSQGFKASLKKPYYVEALRNVISTMLNR